MSIPNESDAPAWRLVPTELSDEMAEALDEIRTGWMTIAEGYHAMLAAAPSPSPAQTEGPSLSRIDELAKVYATHHCSPHHITFTVEGLRHLIAALGAKEIPNA